MQEQRQKLLKAALERFKAKASPAHRQEFIAERRQELRLVK